MIDLSRVEGFQWDIGNARKNQKHEVTQQEAEQVFFNRPLLMLSDVKHSLLELRFHALGKTSEGRLMHISFTLRDAGRRIRVISARTMHKKERIAYAETSESNS